jgi:CDP-diacylglycerol--serine O-phosphatidyltransferase
MYFIKEVDKLSLRQLPNMLTLMNLSLGVLALIFVYNNHPELAAIMVIVAMLTDGLDGRVARALNCQSEFGKELDSLSDVISFGLAPAFIIYVVALQDLPPIVAWPITALFPICGAWRLARFNVVPGTPGYFVGLPIPAAGSVLCTVALFHSELHPVVLLLVTGLLSYLMVSNNRYPNFKKVGIPKNAVWITPIVVAVAILLAALFPGQLSKIVLFPLAIYALYGLRKKAVILSRKLRRSKAEDEEQEDRKAN